MKGYAIVIQSRRGDIDGVVMILDEVSDADAIAASMVASGHEVEVIDLTNGVAELATSHARRRRAQTEPLVQKARR